MDEKQLNKMLSMAAAKLGMEPDGLKKALGNGDINGILSHMDKDSADKVRKAMNDKQVTEDIMKNLKNNK